MRTVKVGCFVLKLLGHPSTTSSLLNSILHQYNSVENSLHNLKPLSQDVLQLRKDLSHLLQERGRPCDVGPSNEILSHHCVGGKEVISVVTEWLDVSIEVYREGGCRRTYPAMLIERPVFKIYQYEASDHQIYYDSVVEVSLISNPEPASSNFRTKPKFCVGTWNLSGATSVEKRMIIDRISYLHQIDILCVQETHLYTKASDTQNYRWIMGPQTSNRASRGCGFLIRKGLACSIEMKVHTKNICHLAVYHIE